jgi:hypothetical protein
MASNVTDPDRPADDTAWFAPGAVLTDTEASELPRFQSGFPPQHVLLTLIGEYGLHIGDPIPSASLVLMLGEFGITQAGARAEIARLARRGILVATRSGRTTAYAMTDRCAWMVAEGRRLTLDFTGAMRSWDGRWTLVSYSIAQERRAQRALLRTRLRWLGFAPMQDGLWVSPPSESDRAPCSSPTRCQVATASIRFRRGISTRREPPTQRSSTSSHPCWRSCDAAG